jgi:hypothetical protein
MGAFVTITLYPAGALHRALSIVGPFLPVAAGVAAAFATRHEPGNPGFYTVAAQVIPVLVVALVFQGRAFDIRQGRYVFDTIVMVYTLLILLIGELSALSGVIHPKGTVVGPALGAIVAGLVAIGVRALLGVDDRRDGT